jgi:hypothetical protein
LVTLPAVEVSEVDATSFSVVRSQRSSQAGKSMRVYNQPRYRSLASDSPTEIFDQVRTQVMRSYELMLTLYRKRLIPRKLPPSLVASHLYSSSQIKDLRLETADVSRTNPLSHAKGPMVSSQYRWHFRISGFQDFRISAFQVCISGFCASLVLIQSMFIGFCAFQIYYVNPLHTSR